MRVAFEVFDRLRELPEAERASRLEAEGLDPEVRGAVERLLSSDGATEEFLGAPVDGVTAGLSAAILRGARPTRIGRYRVLEEIGRGGFACVYLAEQDSPRRRVALKVLRDEFTGRDVRRLAFEAEALAAMDHPNIARVHELLPGSEDGERPCLVMEHVRGAPIDEHAARAGLGVSERARLIVQVCEAVEHAHRRGVLHRDLTPRNILVDESGTAKVLDFGLASSIQRRGGSVGVTVRGSVIGTLRTMSPEQLAGRVEAIDTRSDVFSIGVVAFELLTGRHPFVPEGAGLSEAVRLMNEGPAPTRSSLARELRGDLGAVLLKAVEREPALRYQSASALADDLRAALEGRAVTARRGGTAYRAWRFCRRHRAAVLAGAAAVTIAATLAVNWAVSVRREAAAHARAVHALETMVVGMISPMGTRVGTLEDRAALLEAIGPGVEAMVARAPADARVLSIQARYLDAVGDAARSLGRMERASVAYGKAAEVYEVLWAGGRGGKEIGHPLSLAIVKAGDSDFALDRPEQGRARYHQAMELDRRLARLEPDSLPVLSNLFWSCYRVSALMPMDDPEHDALREEMMVIAERMREISPDDWRSLEAWAHRGLVWTGRREDSLLPAERLPVVEESVRAASRLVESRPDHAGYLSLLVETGRAAVSVSLAAGQRERAAMYAARLADAADRLRGSVGDQLVRTRQLPTAALAQAEVALIQGQWARALEFVNEAVPLFKEREKLEGPSEQVRAWLARAGEIRVECEAALGGRSR